MAFWEVDLTTRMGANTATSMGSTASFVYAGLCVFTLVVFGGLAGLDTTEGLVMAISAGAQALLAVIAGLRLRAGKGAFWGMALIAIMATELVFKLISLNGIGGLVIGAVLLVVIVNGVRGALALRRGTGFDDDIIEAFE